jgi:putative tricarboxylic transport membrane protein
MYVGNLMLLALNLPLVGVFVNLLRIPYAYLYPLIIMFCVIGVYGVNHSVVMSNGNYLIFLQRPIALALLAVSLGLLLMSAVSFLLHRRDWRAKLAEAEAAESK